jgi:antirestriction protein ArdC
MEKKMVSTTDRMKWSRLLIEAVEKPGLISEAFHAFHGYSLGNRMLALEQCRARGITPGPLSTYRGWQEKGRQVQKGEKGIVLCRPITRCCEGEQGEKKIITIGFIERPFWFVLSQTDGESVELLPTPGWDRSRALTALDIREVAFTDLDGNTLGYARGREIAINPLGPMPHETTFHEMAHILIGHGGEGELRDNRLLERNLKEVEAESVALLCCESLGLPGAEYARGYIQAWLRGEEIPEKSAQRIFHAADQILRAGQVVEAQVTVNE